MFLNDELYFIWVGWAAEAKNAAEGKKKQKENAFSEKLRKKKKRSKS